MRFSGPVTALTARRVRYHLPARSFTRYKDALVPRRFSNNSLPPFFPLDSLPSCSCLRPLPSSTCSLPPPPPAPTDTERRGQMKKMPHVLSSPSFARRLPPGLSATVHPRNAPFTSTPALA